MRYVVLETSEGQNEAEQKNEICKQPDHGRSRGMVEFRFYSEYDGMSLKGMTLSECLKKKKPLLTAM